MAQALQEGQTTLYISVLTEIDPFELEYKLECQGIILQKDVKKLSAFADRKNRYKKQKDVYVLLENARGGRAFIHSQCVFIKKYGGKYDQETDSWYITLSTIKGVDL